MVDWDLKPDSDEKSRADRQRAMRFATEILRPAGRSLDGLADPTQVIADTSDLWKVIRQYRQLGLRPIPASGEDPEFSAARNGIVEALGFGDAGLAMMLHADSIAFEIAAISGVPALRALAQDYFEDDTGKLIGCWIDVRLPKTEQVPPAGDDLIIRNYRTRNVVNGSIATHGLLHVTSSGNANTVLALIPLNQAGVERGNPARTMGMRAANQCTLRLNRVAIAGDSLIPARGIDSRAFASMHSGVGRIAVGLAQAAFEQAVGYAEDRVQGGVPIIHHNNVKLKIFNMLSMLQSSRALARSVAQNDDPQGCAAICGHAVAIRATATRTAARLSSEAIQIFGGSGLMKMNAVEKMMRDAAVLLTIQGTNDELALRALHCL